MKSRLVLHPFLLAVLPLFTLYAHNMSEVRPADLAWPLIIVGFASLAVWSALRVLLRDTARAAVLASLFWVWFFLYGHLRGLVPTTPDAIFAVAYCAALAPALALLLEPRPWMPALSSGLNVAAAILVAWQLLAIGGHALQRTHAALGVVETVPTTQVRPVQASRYPNVYYIILDSYARADVLRDLYHCDNSAFLNHLTQRGFSIARHATSNYALTKESLAAALNFRYVHDGAPGAGADAGSQGITANAIRRSRLIRFLRARGYRVVTFASGTGVTDCMDADVRLEPASSLSEFQNALLNTTPLPVVLSWAAPARLDAFEIHRRRVRYAFDRIADTAKLRPPVFVFAHIVCPHPPFVFDRNGASVRGSGPLRWEDGDSRAGRLDTYVTGYAEQVQFVSHQAQAAADALLARSRRPTVIVIQSDHGPASRTVWSHPERTDLRERFGILLACYLPGQRDAPIGNDVSPVNVFRIVLNRYFGTRLPLLPNENYFPAGGRPGRFVRVTDQVRAGTTTR
jgi:hypothetical protein